MNENDCADEQAKSNMWWGSCQYDSAAETYMELCKQELCYGVEVTRAKLFEEIGPIGTVAFFSGGTLEEFKRVLLERLTEKQTAGDDVACLQVQLEDVNDVTAALNYLKEQCWDLWSAAPYIARSVFPELNLAAMETKGINYKTGVICWLLKSYGFVEDDEPSKGWDT